MSSLNAPFVHTVRYAEWELPEVLTAVILLAYVVITITSLTIGLVRGLGQEPGLTHAQVVGVAMQNATSWANPPFAFVLVAGVGLVWWQVRIWSAEIELARGTDDGAADADAVDSPVLVAAFDHLLRAKLLASWSLPLLLVVLTAAAADVASSFVLYRGRGFGGGTIWSDHIETIGFAVATWVLVLAGLVAALYVRTQVSHEFTLAEQAAGVLAGQVGGRGGGAAARGAAGVQDPGAPRRVGAEPMDPEGPPDPTEGGDGGATGDAGDSEVRRDPGPPSAEGT